MKGKAYAGWMARGFMVAALFLCLSWPGVVALAADDATNARHLVSKAQMTLDDFRQAKEMSAFRDLLKDAKGVFIAPQMLKGAFIFGASGGSGVFMVRDTQTAEWSGPAFYTIGGVSFGLQIGGQSSEVILLAMTERGVTALLSSSLKLGADAGVAAGPVGMGASASTANVSGDILSFSRAKGLYGGIVLDGAVVKVRNGYNAAYYNDKVSPTDILVRKTVTNPYSEGLLAALSSDAVAGKDEKTARAD